MKKKRREENGSGLKEKRSAGGAGKGRGTAAPGSLDRGTIHGNRCVGTAVGGGGTRNRATAREVQPGGHSNGCRRLSKHKELKQDQEGQFKTISPPLPARKLEI